MWDCHFGNWPRTHLAGERQMCWVASTPGTRPEIEDINAQGLGFPLHVLLQASQHVPRCHRSNARRTARQTGGPTTCPNARPTARPSASPAAHLSYCWSCRPCTSFGASSLVHVLQHNTSHWTPKYKSYCTPDCKRHHTGEPRGPETTHTATIEPRKKNARAAIALCRRCVCAAYANT